MRRSAFSLRAAACIEQRDDGCEWSIFIINDEPFALDRVDLLGFGHSFGGSGEFTAIETEIGRVASGDWTRLWRDDDFEMRMYARVSVSAQQQQQELLADFPKLYRKKRNLPDFEPIGLPGLAVPFERVD